MVICKEKYKKNDIAIILVQLYGEQKLLYAVIVFAEKKLHLEAVMLIAITETTQKEAVILIAITETTQKCENSTDSGLLTILIMIQRRYSNMQLNMDETNWLM